MKDETKKETEKEMKDKTKKENEKGENEMKETEKETKKGENKMEKETEKGENEMKKENEKGEVKMEKKISLNEVYKRIEQALNELSPTEMKVGLTYTAKKGGEKQKLHKDVRYDFSGISGETFFNCAWDRLKVKIRSVSIKNADTMTKLIREYPPMSIFPIAEYIEEKQKTIEIEKQVTNKMLTTLLALKKTEGFDFESAIDFVKSLMIFNDDEILEQARLLFPEENPEEEEEEELEKPEEIPKTILKKRKKKKE